MVERICPQCQNGNPLENRFCGRCGASLERHDLASNSETSLIIGGVQLPARQVRQVGQALALSLAALAAEAGMAWLRRRVDQISVPETRPQVVTQPAPQRTAIVPARQAPVNQIVTVISSRVVEVWEHGELTRQTVERSFWRREGS